MPEEHSGSSNLLSKKCRGVRYIIRQRIGSVLPARFPVSAEVDGKDLVARGQVIEKDREVPPAASDAVQQDQRWPIPWSNREIQRTVRQREIAFTELRSQRFDRRAHSGFRMHGSLKA